MPDHPLPPAASVPPHPLGEHEASLTEMGRALDDGRVTSRHLVEAYLARIAALNRIGPCLNAVLEVDPDALAVAGERDAERRAGRLRGPLHGLPVLLKDNLVTADRTNTSYASQYLQGVRYQRDSTVAARLRSAGAVLLGKANMVELASGTGLASGRGGPVRNPYALGRGADGSSNGVCAAVAADLAGAGVGTDSRSSIRSPAADCSLVGLRPTFGAVSLAGILPGDPIVDVAGPVTRTVDDAALLLSVLAGPDPRDPATAVSPGFAAELPPASWRGVRVGVPREGFFGVDAEVDRVVEAALNELRGLGAEVVDGLRLESVPYAAGDPLGEQIFAAAQPRALARFFEQVAEGSHLASFEQLRFLMMAGLFPTLRSRLHEMRQLDPALLRSCLTIPEEAVAAARQQLFAAQRRQVDALLEGHRLDLLAFPTKCRLAQPIHPDPAACRYTPRGRPEISSHSGYPEISLAAGYSNGGVPVGLSLLAPAFGEPRLLALGKAFEIAGAHRRPPPLRAAPPSLAFTLPAPPANDRFAQRLTLVGEQGSVEGNLLAASVEREEPRHGTLHPVDRSVWYSWTPERDGRARLRIETPPGVLLAIAVYRGETLGALREVACSNHPVADPGRPEVVEAPGRVELPVQAGVVHHLAVGGGLGRVHGGGFVLHWRLG